MSTAAETGTVKVRLGGLRKTMFVELPSLPGSKVEVYKDLLVSEQRALQAKYPDASKLNQAEQTSMSLYMLSLAVKSWNLVDEKDVPVPIAAEVFEQMTLPDILKMLEACTGQVLLGEDNRPLSVNSPAVGKKA